MDYFSSFKYVFLLYLSKRKYSNFNFYVPYLQIGFLALLWQFLISKD